MEVSITPSGEPYRFENGRHIFFLTTLDDRLINESFSKAVVNEKAGCDLYNVKFEESDKSAIDAFERVSTPLLMVWVYDSMSIRLSPQEMEDEYDYLLRAYTKFCEKHSEDGSALLSASAYCALVSHNVIPDVSICKEHAAASPLVEATLRSASRHSPSLESLCSHFNSLNPPFSAIKLNNGKVALRH